MIQTNIKQGNKSDNRRTGVAMHAMSITEQWQHARSQVITGWRQHKSDDNSTGEI